MKRLFELVILGLLAAGALHILLEIDPGYVRISVGQWLIESNLYVMLVFNIILLFGLAILASILSRLLGSRQQLSRWLGHSRNRKATERTNAGLIAFLEGNWQEASTLLKRGAAGSATPIVNYLAAAHAENEQGNSAEAELLLKKAYEKTDESDFAVGIAKAQMELDQNQLESCLATLVRLKAKKPHHPFVLKLLKSVYLKLEDWQQLIQLIPELKKFSNEDKAKLTDLEEISWRALFTQKADELIRKNQHTRAAEELAALWKKLPDNIRFDQQLILNYAEQLVRLKSTHEAEALLRKILSKHWSDDLIALYGKIRGHAPAEQLISAENWLKERPNNAALLLALGRLSLQNELWGKAMEYFEASNALQSSKECFAELCRLEQYLGKSGGTESKYLKGLIHTLSLPELPQPKPRI